MSTFPRTMPALAASFLLARAAIGGGLDSPMDQLLNSPSPTGAAARQLQAERPLRGEFPQDTQLRLARERAEKALLQAMAPDKVRLTRDISWQPEKGTKISARAGSVLDISSIREDGYIVRYMSYVLIVPPSYGALIPPDPVLVAQAQEQIRSLNEEQQTRMLQKQLAEINQSLQEILYVVSDE